ncbi:MAG: RNase J family beta-CASP ribonuclease [Ruminococcaceae bacterium]|nr:RNase J family beta-CASP ribonuclease [Oscillospiraceae bacterium]
MTEKELDKILTSVLGQKPNVSGKPEKRSAKKSAEAKKPEKEKKNAPAPSPEKPKAPTHVRKNTRNKGATAAEKKPPVQKSSKKATPAPVQAQAPQKPVAKKKGKQSAGTVSAKSGKRGLLRVIPLGGLGEVGKNMTLLETPRDIIIVDCGMGFPDEEMPGVDLVIPDFSYLERNRDKLRGVFLTHGHEDHIGSVPYLLRHINIPVYGTRLTLGILEKKLAEFRYEEKLKLHTVEAGDTVPAGDDFRVEFIHVNHSIADACALAIDTPIGKVVHSGDFKLDVSPIDGQMMDLPRLGEIGKMGVELLLCESTNAEREGFTPSERSVGGTLEQIFLAHKNKRIVIATFSSNVHRVQQIIDVSVRHGRRVAVLGRSMVSVIGAARELGYMDIPDGVLVDVSELGRFKNEEVTLVTTGSQGEPMSALYRMAFGEHDRIKLTPSDLVVLSASAIPGNERLVGKIVNALVKNGIRVINDESMHIHASGHACREELKLLHALLKPKYLMPIHGEARHLYAHKELAEYMGMPSNHIFVTTELGRVLEMKGESVRFAEKAEAGIVLVDGAGVGDVGSVVLRERRQLAEDGLVVVSATVDRLSGTMLAPPDILSSGFVYMKESGDLMTEASALVVRVLERELSRARSDIRDIRAKVSDELSRFFFKQTKRRPLIMVVVTLA